MNRITGFLPLVALTVGLSANVNAALYDRGNGMVYDSDQDLTWLLDANYAATQYAASSGVLGDEDGMMTWAQARDWAESLEFGGYTDWRLPAFTIPGDQLIKQASNDGSTDRGQNINTSHSEMAYLWYEVLGNVPQRYVDGTKRWESKPDRPLDLYPVNTTANGVTFINFQWIGVYALGLLYSDVYDQVWCFQDGYQGYDDMYDLKFYAWAVRDGDVASAPTVSFGEDAVIAEGGNGKVWVTLSGGAHVYPYTISLIVSGTAQGGVDHNLGQTITFNSGETRKAIDFTVADDGVGEGDETIAVSFAGNVNAGARASVTFTITERNMAPHVSLAGTQNGSPVGAKISRSSGSVVVQATATDQNPGDSLSFDWGMTSSSLADLDAGATSFTFDPSQLLPGVYKVAVRVRDNATIPLSGYRHMLFNIVDSLPELSGTMDSDGDGIDDATEGYADSDHDGIPGYLDSIAEVSVVALVPGSGSNYLAKSDSGVSFKLGRFARQGKSGGVRLSDEDVAALAGIYHDTDYANVGGIFDFEAHHLPEPGQTVRFVFPLQAALPAGAVYRKFSDAYGWAAFVEDGGNQLSSVAGEPGFCPEPGDESWMPGLAEGHWCVQIAIEDGGPNDEDGEANGVIVDPGAISSAPSSIVTAGGSAGSAAGGGGAMNYMLLLLGLLFAACRKVSRP